MIENRKENGNELPDDNIANQEHRHKHTVDTAPLFQYSLCPLALPEKTQRNTHFAWHCSSGGNNDANDQNNKRQHYQHYSNDSQIERQ